MELTAFLQHDERCLNPLVSSTAWWVLLSGCETIATAKDGEGPTSIFSTVSFTENLIFLKDGPTRFPPLGKSKKLPLFPGRI